MFEGVFADLSITTGSVIFCSRMELGRCRPVEVLEHGVDMAVKSGLRRATSTGLQPDAGGLGVASWAPWTGCCDY